MLRVRFAQFLLIFSISCSLLSTLGLATEALEETRFKRLNSALELLNITPEPSYARELEPLNNAQRVADFETFLAFFDHKSEFLRYVSWDKEELILYRDRDTKKNRDVTLRFKQFGSSKELGFQQSEIKSIRQRKNDTLPLQGLRVALDPGHMGSKDWAIETGKYVQPNDQEIVREGEIALYVATHLKQELENLGATVLLTRSHLQAVSSLDFKTFDLLPFANEEILASTDQPWFDLLLKNEPTATINQNSDIKTLRSEKKRHHYFIRRADIQARAEIINQFEPHMTLVIHFDSNSSKQLQGKTNFIRAYVPGNVLPEEFASRKDRYLILKQLMDGTRWKESVHFTNSVVQSLSRKLQINLLNTDTDIGAIKVNDGIYARNLALNRRILFGVQAYLECFYYNHVDEFHKLAKRDFTRLDETVAGLKNGILNYLHNENIKQLP